jgi:aldose sugar dehydrogenase
LKITKKFICNDHATANGNLIRNIALLVIVLFAIFLVTFNDTAFSKDALRKFEDKGVGIRLSYPSYWDDLEISNWKNSSLSDIMSNSQSFNKMGCIEGLCLGNVIIRDVDTDSIAVLVITAYDSQDDRFIYDCNCNSLIDFVRDSYNDTLKSNTELDNKIFLINDNQTTIGKNYSARQIEYYISGSSDWKHYRIFVKAFNTFYYDIDYYSQSNKTYTKHLPEIKEILSSLEFLPMQKSKTPIFSNQTKGLFDRSENEPHISDPNLKTQVVAEGLDTPTTMAFLGPNDFLVLEKDKGTVIRVVNGSASDKPVLDVDVANSAERGMCGIAVSKTSSKTYVFLYFTEINGKDGDDRKGKEPEGNRLYRYELVDDKLVDPVLLLDLPAYPGPRHNGGAIEIGPDQNIYIPVGDIDGSRRTFYSATQTQNFAAGITADGRSGILRITQDANPVGEGILGDSMPLRLYYAYGIRNSFGLDFDPVTGSLWDTENGPFEGDEINLVYPGFNSGWQEIYGFSSSHGIFDKQKLVTFGGKGKYDEPKLVWGNSTGLTSLVFLDSDKLGTQYRNDMFVGDVHNGRLYHFKLNNERNDLILPKAVEEKFIENPVNSEAENIVFGDGFGGITDLTIGPDGYLYVVSIGQGKIFRILSQ